MVTFRKFAASLAIVFVASSVSGCATTGKDDTEPKVVSYRSADRPLETVETPKGRVGGLAGRTIRVSSVSSIRLQPKEVVLTFDDGPIAGKTNSVLDTLDRYGVKATFLMVGQMASARPDLVRKVAARGHSVGGHTNRHPNLRGLSHQNAIAEIDQGNAAIRRAGGGDPKFFRFPYLADTKALRSYLASRGTIVLDVDVDSKDYLKSSPAAVTARTMRNLRAKGKGIILMHDLHQRTASALPSLLKQLKAEGYKVVHLKPGSLQVASR